MADPTPIKPGVGDNSSARDSQIKSGLAEVMALDADIAAAVERHIEPLKSKRKKAMRKIKADCNIAIGDLNIMLKLGKRAAEAKADEENGEKILEDLKEIFRALNDGDQLDFMVLLNNLSPQPAMKV